MRLEPTRTSPRLSSPSSSAPRHARTAQAIDLANRVTIEIRTCSGRSIRGCTIGGAVFDEVAFWRSEESANPDAEI
jgi:hypothetical protein